MKEFKKSLQEILVLDCPELINGLYEYVIKKRTNGKQLQPLEEEVYLVCSMLNDIDMEGFIDIFHQLYSWRECFVVEATLRKINLQKLADLFVEAKLIFTNGRNDLTEEEYQNIYPFDEDVRWQRFDSIGEEIQAKESEIYLIGDRMCAYIQRNIDTLLKT